MSLRSRNSILTNHLTCLMAAGLLCAVVPNGSAEEPDWIAPMRAVPTAGNGEPGVVLNIGDSITYSMAYFAPLQTLNDESLPPPVRESLATVNSHIKTECYRWKGSDKGNQGGQTAGWALQHIDRWIETLKPEVAIIMFGTNDIRRGSVEQHAQNLRQLVKRCLDRGVVVILSTIPPMQGFEKKVEQTVQAQRQIAHDLNVPLIDFYAHIMNRRPEDWNGTLPQFKDFDQWQVPTLISKDGVHLSNPDPWRKDFTERGLSRNGNTLRNYLSLMAYAEVIDVVIEGEPPSFISTSLLGPQPSLQAEPARNVGRTDSHDDSNDVPQQDWFPKAPPLPPPSGPAVRVQSVEKLYDAAEKMTPGGTILVAAGRYQMPRALQLNVNDITLRGASGKRTDVVLDFGKSQHHEGITISHCTGVTVADLTVENVRQNGIKINSNLGVDDVTIYNVVSHNVWQRHVKGPRVPDEDGQPAFVERCRIQYCLFYNDRAKRRGDEPWEDENPRMGFNYVGGIDVMSAKEWIISDNVFTGIHGATGEARGGVFLWHNATDCVIERNIFLDCDSGICLGNSSARGERRHAKGCIVRNNFVVRCPENNILADHTHDCKIINNSVHDPQGPLGRLIRVVHDNDGLVVENNIFSGPRIAVETDDASITLRNNLIRSVGEYFVDAERGNLHLKSGATDAIRKAYPSPDVAVDIDRQPRGSTPDLGADQRSNVP